MDFITFYKKNTNSFDSNNILKYTKCEITTSNRSRKKDGLGCDAKIHYIILSDGRFVISNDLWYSRGSNVLPKNALTGEIYTDKFVEAYIYSENNGERI